MKISVGSIHTSDSLFLNMFIATMSQQTRPSLSHSHPFVEIAIVLKGTGTYTVNAEEYPIAPGDLFFFGSNAIHYITNATSSLELLTLQFSTALLVDITPVQRNSPNWRLFSSPVSMCIPNADAEPFQRIMYEIQRNLSEQPLNHITYVNSLIVLLAISLLRFASNNNITLTPTKCNPSMCAALAYIDNNISQHITLQDVSAAAMLSPSYFSSSFKRYTGYSLIDYTNAKRVRLASKMLLNDPNTSISEIAMRVGFNNMSNFNRAFRKYIGCTPSEYISENGKPKQQIPPETY